MQNPDPFGGPDFHLRLMGLSVFQGFEDGAIRAGFLLRMEAKGFIAKRLFLDLQCGKPFPKPVVDGQHLEIRAEHRYSKCTLFLQV